MVYVPPSTAYTDASRRFQQAILDGEPGTENGGLYADKAGYHGFRRDQDPDDYSVRAAVDKLGPDNKSAAHDWTFPEAWGSGGDHTRISRYMRRVQAAFNARDIRLKGWREVLGVVDNQLVGFDFDSWSTRKPDSSHYGHMHFSEHRAFVESWDNKIKMLEVLGIGDDMGVFCRQGDSGEAVAGLQAILDMLYPGEIGGIDGQYGAKTTAVLAKVLASVNWPVDGTLYLAGEYAHLQAAVAKRFGGGTVTIPEPILVQHTHDLPAGKSGPADA